MKMNLFLSKLHFCLSDMRHSFMVYPVKGVEIHPMLKEIFKRMHWGPNFNNKN